MNVPQFISQQSILVHLTLIDVIGKYGINFVYSSKRFKAKIPLRVNTFIDVFPNLSFSLHLKWLCMMHYRI